VTEMCPANALLSQNARPVPRTVVSLETRRGAALNSVRSGASSSRPSSQSVHPEDMHLACYLLVDILIMPGIIADTLV
jgi:hypothetical protein